jgi:hypothetical protein
MLLHMLRADDRTNQLDKSYPLIQGSFSWKSCTSKYFKFLIFLSSRSGGRIAWVVEIERHLFLGKQIITLSFAMHIKLSAAVHARSHHFSPSPSSLCFLIYCLLHRTNFPHAMASKTDQTLLAAGNVTVDDTKIVFWVESGIAAASSSSNAAIEKMAKKDVPMLTDYWKKSMVTEADRSAYHSVDWLPAG